MQNYPIHPGAMTRRAKAEQTRRKLTNAAAAVLLTLATTAAILYMIIKF